MKTNQMFDQIMRDYGLQNDRQLALALGISPAVISRVRNEKVLLGPGVMIKINELFDISIAQIKHMTGVKGLQSMQRTDNVTRKTS